MPTELLDYLTEHFYVPLYLVTWIVAIVRYRRYFDTPLKYFPMIIIYTFFTELLGVLIKYNNNFQFFSDGRYAWHNVIIYNVYQLVFFIFFFGVYQKVLHNQSLKKQIGYLMGICGLVYLVNAIAYNPLHNQMTYAHIIGSVIMVYIVLSYFREKQLEQLPQPLKYNLMFWVSTGILVFYSLFPIISTIYLLDLNIGVQVYFRPLLLTAIALMYIIIIFGLLISKRKAFR